MRALIALVLLLPAQDPAAPAEYKVKLDTTKGDIVLKITREWAPKGADHFHALVKAGYYDDCRFYRVLPKYIAQFGINGTPATAAKWKELPIDDDPVKQKNTRGRLTFAKGGPNSQGFAPIGEIVEGQDLVDQLFSGYGDGAPKGRGPSQKKIYEDGNAWLQKDFKDLDYIKSARIVE
jgi:peptidyl-prolyl cis-trans isomerase A (cyclophilin A)